MKTQIFVILVLHCSISMNSSSNLEIPLLTQRPKFNPLYRSIIHPSAHHLSTISESIPNQDENPVLSSHRCFISVSPRSTPDQDIDQQQASLWRSVILSPRSTPNQSLRSTPDQEQPYHTIVNIPVTYQQPHADQAIKSRCECVCTYLGYAAIITTLGTCIFIHLYDLTHPKPI